MEATLLLCDYAEQVNGKLYIQGGGWSWVISAGPMECYVAVRLAVPWNDANQKHSLRLELLTEDGQPVLNPAVQNQPIALSGQFEMGRPPGVTPGDDLVQSMAFRFQGLDIPSGGYHFSLKVNDNELGRLTFRFQRQPAPQMGET